MMMMMT